MSVVSEGGGGGWRSKRALSFGGEEGMWAVGGYGGGGAVSVETVNYWIFCVLERKACGRWVCWRRGRHVGGGVVGTLLWVVNVVGGCG